VIGQCANPSLSSVAHDPVGIIRTALRMFADRGHRAVGFAASPATDIYHRLLTEAWYAEAPAFGFDGEKWVASCVTRNDAEVLARRWRSMENSPTGVLSYTDTVGFGFGTVWKEAGVSLAEGHDLVTISASPHLQMIGAWYFDMDFDHLAVLTARELLRLLTGEPPSGPLRILPKLAQAQ
jgi:DNA-binding LacI/PurR family transcriptional regulator